MSELDFGGRVVAVTGAGRGIGRAYAQLLAARGAAVVVNDLGGGPAGGGADDKPATRTVDRIRAAGGTAVANTDDVSTVDGGRAVVETALKEFGRIDVVIANAGNTVWGGLPDVDAANLDAHLAVHVRGSFHVVAAAWPHLAAQDYGRIVLTTSIGMFGLPDNLGYATAKAAILGMTRGMAASARGTDVKVNCIAPNALTRLAARPTDAPPTAGTGAFRQVGDLDPAAVAPLAAYLAHQGCPVSGEVYVAGGGRFARLFVGVTPGYLHRGGPPRVEDVAEHWADIQDEGGYYVPTDPVDWSTHFMSHLYEQEQP